MNSAFRDIIFPSCLAARHLTPLEQVIMKRHKRYRITSFTFSRREKDVRRTRSDRGHLEKIGTAGHFVNNAGYTFSSGTFYC
jgi:hypothetical protein